MNIKQTTLANGLRIVMVPQPEAATATVLVLAGTGSDYETDSQQGISHFLEHLCFKGTPTRPTAKIISETLDRVGAICNAFTDHECTGYYAKGSPEHINLFIDILSDIYLHASIDASEMEKEKGVIVEEINMYEDMPQYKVGEQLYAAAYPNQAAGRPIAGTKESVRAFSPADIVAYRDARYVAANTVVVVSGAFDAVLVKKLIAKAFAAVGAGKPKKKARVVLAPRVALSGESAALPEVVCGYKKTDQAHMSIMFPSLPIGHKDLPALSLLGTILGGGMSSRLFVTLREEMGVAYYVRCDHETYADHGLFGISAGVSIDRLQEVVDTASAMLAEVKRGSIAPDELSKAKEYTIGMMRLGLESSDDIAQYVGMQLLLKGEIKTPAQRVAIVRAVTAADIARVAKKVLVGANAYLSIVGPYNGNPVNIERLANL